MPKMTIEFTKDTPPYELQLTGGITLRFETLESMVTFGKAIQDFAIRQMMIEAGIGAYATPTLPNPSEP